MAKIEGIRVKNFKVLQDLRMGQFWNDRQQKALTPLTAVIGKNGSGKSTLFDVFGFLSDALKLGVEEACDARGRGGFHKLYSQGQKGPMEFEIYYKESIQSRPITYELALDLDSQKRPFVLYERLRQRRQGQRWGRPFSFLVMNRGEGPVWKGPAPGFQFDEDKIEHVNEKNLSEVLSQEESKEMEYVKLDDSRRLAIATLGVLKQHPRISAFRRFIESWYLSYFTPDAARSLPLAGPQKHLNMHGDNLANVVQFMEREQPKKFQSILKRIAAKIPGVESIDTKQSDDGRLLLRFQNKGFSSPFYAQQISDGTLKLFAYLLMLEDPAPSPFMCIEEPENGLYHRLLEALVEAFREKATAARGGVQIFVTTHQPYFVDGLEPEEVWILEKNDLGFSSIRRASDDKLVTGLHKEGQTLGDLWYSNYLDGRMG